MKQKLKKAISSFFNSKIRLWAVILACVIFAGGGWGFAHYEQTQRFGGEESLAEAKKYLEVRKTLEDNYVGETDFQSMNSAAFTAMVKALGDKWSYYMSADEYAAYQLYNANEYQGIGITIRTDDSSKGFEILSVASGSPAEAAGVKAGDILLAVDAQDVRGMTAAQVRTLITEHIDEKVVITLKTDSGSTDVSVDCTSIYSNPVSYELLKRNVGYVRIANFRSGAGTNAAAAVDDLLSQGARYIVFDVRDNPGGLLTELIRILDHLLPEGDIFISVDKSGAEEVTRSDNVCIEVPMAVLVNENSYSAAEFFAAALKDYGWAEVVGRQTTGKARSQITLELSDGSAVHISSKTYLTPNRVDLSHTGGLAPDVWAEVGDKNDVDGQLEAAINAVLGK